MDELVAGLRNSSVPYLWVSRVEASWFKESCENRGLVIPSCDQLRVLCHSSIGGFLTHCGWNSTLELFMQAFLLLLFLYSWIRSQTASN
ncbi:hypothetical protein SLEP1_g21006 [Rubroshorea leprosula]|uniref:Uncharacterized protein n=1 Tax=Rubroshorea leprosula TaxID=152421 RepID=A0AAV5JGI8_9ROSI|nr:hypothetical protein SLEP1_g21006 [Rubroshorea leprosula]